MDDPFWDEHKPGDRWNCKCELRQTDKQSTPAPVSDGMSDPAPGLESNPAKAKEVFSDSHPYYPDSCLTCPFAGNRLMALAHDLAQGKHCNSCGRVDRPIEAHLPQPEPKRVLLKEFKNGGSLSEYDTIPHDNSDYKALRTIGRYFASQGSEVCLTPRVHFKDAKYRDIYASLIGTPYERKCPDLLIDGMFYEYESFVRPWSKKKVGRMLSHGLVQSDRIIIDNSKGCSHRYIKKLVGTRMRNTRIEEVWLYEKGKLVPLFIEGKYY